MTATSKEVLLPCPFCGGEGGMQTWTDNFSVACRSIPYCVEARPAKSYEEAAKIWNHRPSPPDDANRLPLEMLPKGWRVFHLRQKYLNPVWECSLRHDHITSTDDIYAEGLSPRAALLAAISKIKPEGAE